MSRITPLLLLAVVIPAACDNDDDSPYTEDREPCADYNPLKNAYFGELHMHTGFSFDAWAYGNTHHPRDAYRFARGEPLPVPPLDENGDSTRMVQLSSPLDFAMVTDHSEFLGEVLLCITPGSPAYDDPICQQFRLRNEDSTSLFGVQTSMTGQPRWDFCNPEDPDCIEQAAEGRWLEVQAAAAEYYDRTSSCEFVTFIGYEYTNTTDVSNLHRNVIFRNDQVTRLPITFYEAQTPWELWRQLKAQCKVDQSRCDVMVIAHNSNLSNGKTFAPRYDGAATLEEEREAAALRQEMEPLVEIFQHKGDMECRNGMSDVNGDPDPLCDFEKVWPADAEDCGDGTGSFGMRLGGCLSRNDFVRNAFKVGLKEEARLGINPFRLGVMAATDTHNSIGGKVEEYDFPGHIGEVDDTPIERLGSGNVTHDGVINNPGGLTVVWAEERSRDAIFTAMRRGEVYATSGPRLILRLFGGWSYDAGLCSETDWLLQATDNGVPMGGSLEAPPDGASAPTFLVYAEADPGVTDHPGVPLQRLQIIKGWLEADGEAWEQVFDVAGDPENGASVDVDTCQPLGTGDDTLCAVWTDPEFDLSQRAFYYARVVQNPTCRWSTWECNRLLPDEQPDTCDATDVPRTLQERAWSSPIWYSPAD